MIDEITQDNQAYTYDDKLLVPGYSDIKSRNENTNTSCELFDGMKFEIPIIPANMNMVTEHKMVTSMLSLGGTGILHRFMSPNDVSNQVKCIIQNGTSIKGKFGISVGVDNKFYDLVFSELEKEDLLSSVGYVAVDVAHGDHILVKRTLQDIKSRFDFPIIAGNICTPEAAQRLIDWGADCLKGGIGGGSVCTTRIKTGFGYPQLSAVQNIYQYLLMNNLTHIKLIADGGIKQEGDIVKALAAGADFVMVGGMIAGTDKTPGKVLSMGGEKYKMYEGMASVDSQVTFFNKSSDDIAPEGEATQVKYRGKGSLEKKIKNMIKYIQTGMSYAGCHDLKELKDFGQKPESWVIQTYAGMIEGTPHGA